MLFCSCQTLQICCVVEHLHYKLYCCFQLSALFVSLYQASVTLSNQEALDYVGSPGVVNRDLQLYQLVEVGGPIVSDCCVQHTTHNNNTQHTNQNYMVIRRKNVSLTSINRLGYAM